MMFGAKGSTEGYMAPSMWMPQKVENFLQNTCRLSNEEFLKLFEAAVVGGPNATAHTGRKIHAEIKMEVTTMLLRNLST